MSLTEKNPINIKTIIKDYISKNSNEKINISKFIKYLGEKNISINNFYFQCVDDLTKILANLNNSIKIKKFFSEVFEKEKITFKVLEILSESNKLVSFNEDDKNSINLAFEEILDVFFNIIIKVMNVIEKTKAKKDKNYEKQINNFMEEIMLIIKIIFEKESKCGENYLNKKDNFDYFIQQDFSRKILYQILKMSLTYNKSQKEDQIKYKGSLKLINSIIKYINNNIKENNINQYFFDIEQIIQIYKNHLFLITEPIVVLLQNAMDLFNTKSEISICYDHFFQLCFNDIIFEGKSENEYNSELIGILFELFKYLLAKKYKPLIDIFLIKLFFSVNSGMQKIPKKNDDNNTSPWGKRYNWLLTGTDYMKTILDTLPLIFDEGIFAFYTGMLMSLINSSEKNKVYIPEIDFVRFFGNLEKYLNNKNYENKKERLINLFAKKICDIMDCNSDVVKIVLQKCNIFDIIMKLINKEKDDKIKINLIGLIEKFIAKNKENYDYSFNIDIRKDMNNEVDYRINIFTVGYENDNATFNSKIEELINYMEEYSNKRQIIDFIQISNFLFKIISEYQFKKINEISDKNLIKFNNLLIQMSVILSNPDANNIKSNETDINGFISKFLNSIFKYIIQLNLKKFKFKLTKYDPKNTINYTKKIIEKKTLKYVIKNLLLSQNHIVKKKSLEFLLLVAIDEKNNLILSSYILYIITKIYYQDKNYKSITKIFDAILNLIKKFEINAKILLYYDFVTIALNILLELYGKENEYEEYYKFTFTFLEEIAKYLNQNLLMTYLNQVLILFNKNVLDKMKDQDFETPTDIPSIGRKRENVHNSTDIYEATNIIEENDNNIKEEKNDIYIPSNEEEKVTKKINEELCYKLLELLKKNLQQDNLEKYYIILSNHVFQNHMINNLLYFTNLKFTTKDKDTYVQFKLFIKIESYKGLDGFILLQIINQKSKISFIIKKNSLEIKEGTEYSSNLIYTINDFDKILLTDNEYHDVTIDIETNMKTIDIKVDSKKIIPKPCSFKDSVFDEFNVIIGFNNTVVDSEENSLDNKLNMLEKNSEEIKADKKKDICFVYISYFFVFNTLIDDKNLSSIFESENSLTSYPNLLNYLYRKNNKNYGKIVITEMNFLFRNIYLSQAKNIKNRINEINSFLCLSNNIFFNRYIIHKKVLNNFNIDSPMTDMYIISKNKNLDEFCALNGIWELENINKSNVCSKINNNFNTKINLMNFNMLDFFFGFFFLVEKKIYELKLKNKETEEKINEQDEQEDIGLGLYGDYFANGDIILEYILQIMEIIFLFPCMTLEKYFFGKNILKLKFFLYRNITLFKNDDAFIEKFLKIISKNEFLLMLILSEIFFDINIFSKLNYSAQNSIINYFIDYSTKINTKIENSDEEHRLNSIYDKILNSCINIIIFTELSPIENDEGKFHIDLLINNIEKIVTKLIKIKNDEKLVDILELIFYSTYNICLGFDEEKNNHITKEHYKEFGYIYFEESGEDEEYLEEKLNNIAKQIQKLYNLICQNDNISSFIKSYDDKTKKLIGCCFCEYLNKLFYIKSKFIYDEYYYIKLYNRFFRNYYQNIEKNSGIFGPNDFIWTLSLKESNSKIQNKFFLKENKIKSYLYENPKTKVKTLYFKYIINEEEYKHKFKELNKLFFYDKISCPEQNLIKAMNPFVETTSYYNCLIINKLHKILSTFVLYKDCIIIYYYICLDADNKVHIVRNNNISHTLWLKNQDEFKEELENYIKENENAIKDEIYKTSDKKDEKERRANLKSFNYNKNFKFSRKIIHLKKINEIHKRSHLQIQNSLEIFTSNGESYFIVFNPETRELIFDQILSNIDELYKDKKNPILAPSITNKENIFYMKHAPSKFLTSEFFHTWKNHKIKQNPKNKSTYKCIIEINLFKDDFLCEYWAKGKITNYDYIMILNTLSGRTFNDLSQYFIFPWIIYDFNKNILNWMSNSIYRDLSLPIHACGEDIEKIKNKYELLDDEKYHSGTFYSAHTFVCYFLVRLHPFIEIHLEIQGARFDARARMFNGAEQLSEIAEKFQELIPHLFYLPEVYIKLNYILEDINKDDEIMSDFVLPTWSKDDPRKFALILRKLLESKNINENLNKWFDLIFGYQQIGPSAEKALNTYRNSCYPLSKVDLEKMVKSGEIESYLYEKEELGYIPKQLLKKQHKCKDKTTENKKIFFDSEERITQLNLIKIKEDIKPISFYEYNDIIFLDQSGLNNLKTKFHYQGGLSSLPSLMNMSSDHSSQKKEKEKEKKFSEQIKCDENFIVLKKNYFFLSKYYLFLTFCDNSIKLINIKAKESKLYLLMENTEISCLTVNSKGNEFFVGFANGLINHYKIIKDDNSNINENSCYILTETKISENIYINNNNLFMKGVEDNLKLKIELISCNNYFNENNPHVYQRINLIAFNESHNTLIALDQGNIIYILSLNNNFKLMHKSEFISKLKYKMKEIFPIQNNGDFIIYSPFTVNLFSINGVPLCSLNILDKDNENIQCITHCTAMFNNDIVLFTAHKDGLIIIWKVLNKDLGEAELNEKNKNKNKNKKNKIFLKEYLYAYNYRNYMNSGIKLSECQLQREFEEIFIRYLSGYKKNKNKNNNFVTYMKISNDLDYMILMDNEKNIYILNNNDNNQEPKKKNNSNNNINNLNQKCLYCDRELTNDGLNSSLIQVKDCKTFVCVNQDINICEECEKRLEHAENFLYTN